MKTFDILSKLEYAETSLQYARTAVEEIAESYFSSFPPSITGNMDVTAFLHHNPKISDILFDYEKIANFLGMALSFLTDVQDYITLAETGLEERLSEEKKSA